MIRDRFPPTLCRRRTGGSRIGLRECGIYSSVIVRAERRVTAGPWAVSGATVGRLLSLRRGPLREKLVGRACFSVINASGNKVRSNRYQGRRRRHLCYSQRPTRTTQVHSSGQALVPPRLCRTSKTATLPSQPLPSDEVMPCDNLFIHPGGLDVGQPVPLAVGPS